MKLENDIAQHLEQGEFLALATIIDRSGSAPRHAGAQMLVTRDLSVIGTIGGGQVESDVLAACLPVRKGGTARLMHFDMTGFTPDADMICGGIVDILVERITPEQLPFFRQAAACRSRAAFGVWLVDITDPASPQRSFHTDAPALPAPVLAQVRSNSAACIDLDGRRVYIEPLIHQGVVVLCGGGHVSLPRAGWPMRSALRSLPSTTVRIRLSDAFPSCPRRACPA
ncbi:MAG: XdhC family protein [Bilophila wadsworthia]